MVSLAVLQQFYDFDRHFQCINVNENISHLTEQQKGECKLRRQVPVWWSLAPHYVYPAVQASYQDIHYTLLPYFMNASSWA